MQLSHCLDESWEAMNAHKELQTGGISDVFDQKLVVLNFSILFAVFFIILNDYQEIVFFYF